MAGLDDTTRRSARLLGLAVGLACACGNGPLLHGADSDTAGTAYADPGGPSRAPNGPSGTKGTAMASSDNDIATAQRAIADEYKVAPGDVRVRPLHVAIPGITVFSASVDPRKAGRAITRTGAVEGGTIYVEAEAMSRVARAWGYGAKRTVPATTVAQVFAELHDARNGSSTYLDDDTLAAFKKVAGPRRGAAMALPKEATVDGNPAVVYCVTTGRRASPFNVVTAIIKPDFQVELRVHPVNEE
jgi:hypothetical protein